MRGTVVAVAAALATAAVGAAWYRRRRARDQPPLKTPPPSAPCCAAKEAAVGAHDGAHAGVPLEPLCAQLVEYLRARLASLSPSPSTSASQGAAVPARDHAALHRSAASEAWLAAVRRLVQSDVPGEEAWRVELLVACAEEAQVKANPNPNADPNPIPNPNPNVTCAELAWCVGDDGLGLGVGVGVGFGLASPNPNQACLRGVWATMGAHLLASTREAARLKAAVQAEGSP